MESKLTSEQFTYWLQGYFEISGTNELNSTQVQIIKDHLDLVFNKVTPVRTSDLKVDKEYLKQAIPPFILPSIFQPTQATDICFICGKNHNGLPCPIMTIICQG